MPTVLHGLTSSQRTATIHTEYTSPATCGERSDGGQMRAPGRAGRRAPPPARRSSLAPDGRAGGRRAGRPLRGRARGALGSHPTGGGALVGHGAARAELLDAVLTALSRARTDAPEGRVVALGVTSMAESGVLLEPTTARGRPGDRLARQPRRGEVADRGCAPSSGREFSARTGLPLRSQWSLTKHRWQLDNDVARGRGRDAGSTSPNGSCARSAASR